MYLVMFKSLLLRKRKDHLLGFCGHIGKFALLSFASLNFDDVTSVVIVVVCLILSDLQLMIVNILYVLRNNLSNIVGPFDFYILTFTVISCTV